MALAAIACGRRRAPSSGAIESESADINVNVNVNDNDNDNDNERLGTPPVRRAGVMVFSFPNHPPMRVRVLEACLDRAGPTITLAEDAGTWCVCAL